MKTVLTIFTVVAVSVLSGCNGIVEKGNLLTVDFREGQPLRYKFVSSRDTNVDWNPTDGKSKAARSKSDRFSESMEMVVTYRPVAADPYGLTTIEATCESVKIKRSSSTGRRVARKDAVENLSGKTFTFTVGPTGKIDDYSQLDALIRQIGEKVFRAGTKGRRIKEPDMIGDFIVTQWFLWDSVSSIEEPIEGVSIGQSWYSKLSVPVPMVLRKARDVTYTLDEIRESPEGRLAVIRSSYLPSKTVPTDWPIPYSGSFQVSGTFGFLRRYRVLDLQGEGQELFNIDLGRTEQYEQNYQMKLAASLPMAIGVNTTITIKQNLKMQLLE